MSNHKLFFAALIILFFALPQLVFSQASTQRFSFTLNQSCNTSAGVFKNDGTLVRTLWSNRNYAAGSYSENWDGLLDNGTAAPSGTTYQVKLLSNNVKYTWEGVLGNTSQAMTGTSHYHAYQRMYSMAISGNNAYFAANYNEQLTGSFKFNTASPNTTKAEVSGKGGSIPFVAADNTNVYWAAVDPNNLSKNFIFATSQSSDKEISFTNGTSTTVLYSNTHPSAIDISANKITGLAVQKTGNYLFVSYKNINQIHVINKNTGALVQTLSFTTPSALAIDGNDNLWMASGNNTVAKYNVISNGTLSAPVTTLSGLVAPIAIGASPDNITIAVCDAGTSQQVKGFNSTTGTISWTLGTAGGYSSSPSVNDNKFYFSDLRTTYQTFITYQPDGSFWVGDAGNVRAQHYSAGRTFINRVMYLEASYSSQVDKNKPTRVFSDYLEFAVDYTTTLSAWKLVNNWGASVSSSYDDQFKRLKGVATLSNGRTYATLYTTGGYEIVELTATGVRTTGVKIGNGQLYPDGSIRSLSQAVIGSSSKWSKKALTGFDGLGNPTYGSAITVASTPAVVASDPVYYGNDATLRAGEMTTSGLMISFEASKTSTDYHVGAIDPATNTWKWKSARNTKSTYIGEYPKDGFYDIGNSVNSYAGSVAVTLGNNIFWGYHGEFWKNSQVNKWQQLNDDGLMIGQFGATGVDTSTMYEPFTGMAGNAFAASIVQDPNDATVAYLYHNDESFHSGVHRWKITGLNTISEITLNFASNFASLQAVSTSAIDLMAGLPYNAILADGTAGWNRNPVAENYTNLYSSYWSSKTSMESYNIFSSTDLYTSYRSSTGTSTITRDLGTNNVSGSWTLAGTISYNGNEPNQGTGGGSYFEVLDANGKIISRFYPSVTTYPSYAVFANNQTILTTNTSSAIDIKTIMNQTLPINITANANGVTFTYGSYPAVTAPVFDAAANWKAPKTMRLYFFGNGQNYSRVIDIKTMKFIVNNTITTPNTTPDAPVLSADDNGNTLSASSPLGASQILVSQNGASFVPYTGTINVGNVARPAGYWQFKISAATGRNESSLSNSPAFSAITASVVVPQSTVMTSICPGTGGLSWEYWMNVSGIYISQIPLNTTPSGTKTITSFTTPTNFADSYGSRVRGYICPPQSGMYTFYFASDDHGELYLSTDDNAATKTKIAYVYGWTNPFEYTKYPSQQSVQIYLQAGQRYYIETLMKEGYCGDNMSVSWKLPDGTMEQPIAGTHLIPYAAGTSARIIAQDTSIQYSYANLDTTKTKTVESSLTSYPNPIVTGATIEFSIKKTENASIQIFNQQGSLVETLYQGVAEKGKTYTAKIANKEKYAAGVYVCRLSTGTELLSRKLLFVK